MRKKKVKKSENEDLVTRCPWLRPLNVDEMYNYERTRLDEMNPGWKAAFGRMMQDELRAALLDDGRLNWYGVDEIGDEAGELYWNDYGGNEKTDAIVQKYINLSRNICACCGMPDVPQTFEGHKLEPLCCNCYEQRYSLPYKNYMISIAGSPIKMREIGRAWGKRFDCSNEADKIRVRFQLSTQEG